LKKFISNINNNLLLKGNPPNNNTVLAKILAGIITSKVIAVLIGAEGMALIGNMRSFLNSIHSFSVLGLYKGVVKFIAEQKNEEVTLSKSLSTAFYLGFLSTILLSFLSYYNASEINDFLFSNNYDYAYIIKILALALPFYALNMFSFSILEGFSKHKILSIISIMGQVLGLLVTVLLIYQDNIDGALIAVVISPSLVFLITLVGFLNRKSLVSQIKMSRMSFSVLKRVEPFAITALVSAVALPFVSILIRNYIIDAVGIREAGYWEAMNRISDYYLMFVMSLMTYYVLPKFKNIQSKTEFKKKIKEIYKTTIPAFLVGLIILYFLRSLVVIIIFNEDFKPVENLFLWQLLGDFIKVLSFVVAYQFVAKQMFAHFIIIEVFLVLVMYFTSAYFIDYYGVKGAVLGHFFSYLMYFLITLLMLWSSLFGVDQELES